MARFGDMLYQRRRQMGLTILQVANTIKIRPQIIEFFENGDFTAMPPRGYAQGMISSYARYLGLNPREVVEAYFEDLRAYEQATDNHGGRFQDAAGLVSTRSASATGRFMMVDSAPRSRYAQRPPQAGYVSETESGHEPQLNRSPYRQRPYGVSSGAGPRRADQTMSMPAYGRSAEGHADPRGTARRRQQGQVRPSGSGRGGAPYRNAPGRGGRPPHGGRQQGRGSAPAPDNRLLIALIAAGLVIIVLLALLLFRGCTPADATSGAGSEAATPETTQAASPDTPATSTDDAADDTHDAEADPEAETTEEPQQLVVRVSVPEGESSWLEIRLDGSIVYGNEVIGPFEQEYTVTESIRITANTPSSVTVTQNGETVRWDTSTSGVARINLTAPETPATTGEAATTTDGETGDAAASDPSAAAAQ